MSAYTILSLLATIVVALTSRVDESRKWPKRILVIVSTAVACLAIYTAQKGHKAELAEARKYADAQAKWAEGLRIQNQVLHGDVQARVRAVEEISRLIAKGCISDPKLLKQADEVHAKLTRGGPEEIGVQIHLGPGATAVKNENND